jgi:hypothetical protein
MLQPLNIVDVEIKTYVDALFYSSASISLIGTAISLKKSKIRQAQGGNINAQ